MELHSLTGHEQKVVISGNETFLHKVVPSVVPTTKHIVLCEPRF